MAAADYRLLTEATGQRIAAALEALSGTGAAAAAARTNLDVYSKGETDTAIAQSTALHSITDCDDAPMGDSYIQGSDTAHTPTATGYYFIHSFNVPTSPSNAQIAIRRNSTYVDTYVRNKSSGAWGAWRQLSVLS